MSIGPMEIIIVLAIALLVMGPSKLPHVGRSLGKGIREFRHAAETAKTELGLDGVLDEVKVVKDDITSSLGIDELKAGLDDVKTSMGVEEITAGVGGIRTAIADPRRMAKDAVMGKPAGKRQKAGAEEAQADDAGAQAVADAERLADVEPATAVVGV